MGLDRQLQLQILEYLEPHYGHPSYDIEKQDFTKNPDYDANLKYLYDSHFIKGNQQKQFGTTCFVLKRIEITKHGLDFLEALRIQSEKPENQNSEFIKDIHISHSTITLGDNNEIHHKSSQNKNSQAPAAAQHIIMKILIGIFVAVAGSIAFWYLQKYILH
jgi:hypothetical protein